MVRLPQCGLGLELLAGQRLKVGGGIKRLDRPKQTFLSLLRSCLLLARELVYGFSSPQIIIHGRSLTTHDGGGGPGEVCPTAAYAARPTGQLCDALACDESRRWKAAVLTAA